MSAGVPLTIVAGGPDSCRLVGQGATGVALLDVKRGVIDHPVSIDGLVSVAAAPSQGLLATGDLEGSSHVLATAEDKLTCWPLALDGWPAGEPLCGIPRAGTSRRSDLQR